MPEGVLCDGVVAPVVLLAALGPLPQLLHADQRPVAGVHVEAPALQLAGAQEGGEALRVPDQPLEQARLDPQRQLVLLPQSWWSEEAGQKPRREPPGSDVRTAAQLTPELAGK